MAAASGWEEPHDAAACGAAAAGAGVSAEVSAESGSAARRIFPKHLIESYIVDKDPLAEGGFGQVFRCRHRATDEVRALKKIDTTHTPARCIAKEVALMKILKHPSVVRCHSVFLETHYVNVVVDMFGGGDLIDGLNAHRAVRGSIPDSLLAALCRQMLAGIAHVHGNGIVHRDIKGENYLLDRRDIGDPACRIALTDFGLSSRLENGKLEEQVGTKAFWAPEVWAKSYEFGIDVWALGCTTYLLLTGGRLPFDSDDCAELEAQICREKALGESSVSVPFFTSRGCRDFIGACLVKDAALRKPAVEVAKQEWLNGGGGGGFVGLEPPSGEQVAKGVGFAAEILVDCITAVLHGCINGVLLCLNVSLSGGQAQQSGRLPVAPSAGAGAAAAGAAAAAAPSAAAAAAAEVSRLTDELEHQIVHGSPGGTARSVRQPPTRAGAAQSQMQVIEL